MSQETMSAHQQQQSESDTFRVKWKGGRGGPPPTGRTWGGYGGGGWGRKLVALALALTIGYLLYFWEVQAGRRRPRARAGLAEEGRQPQPQGRSDHRSTASQRRHQRVRRLGHRSTATANGILEQVYPEGTYFKFGPFDYERYVIKLDRKKGERADDYDAGGRGDHPGGQGGIVVKKFGKALDPGQVLADPNRDPARPAADIACALGATQRVRQPVRLRDQARTPDDDRPRLPGRGDHHGRQAGACRPNEYLVKGRPSRATQQQTEPEGFRYINPFEKTDHADQHPLAEVRDERQGRHQFPSADSFDISLEGFVEWSIDPDKLALIYVQYGEGGPLIEYLEEKVILPYARSFCRLGGQPVQRPGLHQRRHEAEIPGGVRAAIAGGVRQGGDRRQAGPGA